MGLMIGILALVSLAFCAFMFTMYVLRVIGRWRMFKKAGFHGQHSLVPVLNAHDWFDMAGFNKSAAAIGTVATGILFFVVLLPDSLQVDYRFLWIDDVIGYAGRASLTITVILHLVSFFTIPKRFGKSRANGFLFVFSHDITCLVAGFSRNWKYKGENKENEKHGN